MAYPFQALMGMEKSVAGSPEWSVPEGMDKAISLTVALDAEERTIRGLELSGRAKVNSPDANISFSLVYHPTVNRRDAVRLARVDWRPPTPHVNTEKAAPPELYLLEIEGSHHHSFELNWRPREGRPLKWLPVAEPILPDFQGFSDLLDGVGKLFRISNIGSIPEPEWAVELL